MSRYEPFETDLTSGGDRYGSDDGNAIDSSTEEPEPKPEPEPAASDPKPQPLTFEAINPPEGYTPLTFRPTILTRRVLLAITAFYLCILGLLGYLIHRSLSSKRWEIRNVNYYLAARYLPAVIGVCTNALFTSTTSTLRRFLPFIHLADQKHFLNKYWVGQTVCARYFPLSQRFHWKIWFLICGNLTIHFTIAAKATLFTVADNGGHWLVSVRLISAAFLAFEYLLIASINIFIAIRYASCSTGLKANWDPTSLADIILLFAPSDTVPKLKHSLDYIRWYNMFSRSGPKYRLGYWRITNAAEPRPSIIYGIREINPVSPPTNTKHLRCFNDYMDQKGSLDSCCQHIDILRRLSDQPSSRFAVIRIWFFNGTVLKMGPWTVQSNDTTPAPNGTSRHDKAAMTRDSLAYLLLRFLPIMIVGWAGGSITTMDIHHRWVQPFTNMYEKASLVSETLLLDYMTVSPLDVIPQAWANGNYRVVYFGVLSALNWVPPLIMTGLCAITETGSGVVVQLSPTAACCAIVYSSIYIYSLTSYWPPAKRRLPRDVGSLYDYFCFFYDSQLRWYPEFGHAAFSKNITKDELHAMLRLRRDEFRFGLVGDPQDPHPGLDVARHVTWVAPIPSIYQRIKNLFRRRRSTSNANDNGSDSNSEDDAIPLQGIYAPIPTRHRGSSIREAHSPAALSTAVH
ncbi:hypothetical protein KCU81_g6515, partial [Aureobasidium melanogenum]